MHLPCGGVLSLLVQLFDGSCELLGRILSLDCVRSCVFCERGDLL